MSLIYLLACIDPSTYRLLHDGSHGSLSTTRFPLPQLLPPSDGLIALLDAPTTARLHVPIPLRLTVRNRHPTRTATPTVQIEPDAMDAFVIAGLRHGRMPVLLPGQEDALTWNLIPVQCGLVRVPRVKVLDRRSAVQLAGASAGSGAAEGEQAEGDDVEIVDVRWDGRPQRMLDEEGVEVQVVKGHDAYVLVVP